MISTYKRASIAHKTQNLLVSHDIAMLASMNVRAKIERVSNAPRLNYKMRLSAIIASDNRTGKVWG